MEIPVEKSLEIIEAIKELEDKSDSLVKVAVNMLLQEQTGYKSITINEDQYKILKDNNYL